MFNAYATMMPVIEAEERLAGITDAAVAGCNLEKEESERIVRELKRCAGSRESEAKQTMDPNMRNAILASMGIAVVDLRKKKKIHRRGAKVAKKKN